MPVEWHPLARHAPEAHVNEQQSEAVVHDVPEARQVAPVQVPAVHAPWQQSVWTAQ